MRVLMPVPMLPLDLEQLKGGLHSAVANLLHGYAETQATVRVVSFTRQVERPVRRRFADNVELHYEPEGRYRFHSLNYLIHGPGILSRQIREFDPDIVHYEEGNAFLLTRLRGGLLDRPYLLTVHGMALEEARRKDRLADKLAWYFNGWVQRRMTPGNIIHLSRFSRAHVDGARIAHEAIIPNAIASAYFDVPLKPRTDNVLMYVGVIDSNKNLIFLLNALAELTRRNKPYVLEVLGDFRGDGYRKLVLEHVERHRLSDRVRFHGWVSQSVVVDVMRRADVLVVSSMHESLPMVIAECMAAGKVVVASGVGGIPEMIEHAETGFLFPLAEPEALVGLLERLYDNHEQTSAIGQRARAMAVERYQCRNVALRTIAFYQECLR